MRPSIRFICLLFIAGLLAYKGFTNSHSAMSFTDAVEAAYGSGEHQTFFTADVKFLLSLAAFIIITYLPFGRMAEEADDIWTAERRRRMPQTH